MAEQLKEVLVVDNIEDFADECVDFIHSKCGVGAIYALDADQAKEMLKQYPIKVILLDYDMPVTGLELFPIFKKIDQNVQIVFLSAVATENILYEAEKLPFAAKLAKSTCYERLPQLIPTLMLEYEKKINSINNDVFYAEKKGVFSRQFIEYSMVSYNIIDKEYIFPDSWKTSRMVKSGETVSEREEIDYERTFELSERFQLTTDFETSIEQNQILNLKAKLLTQLENSIKSGYTERIKGAISWMRELSLKGDNNDPSIVSKFYDFAQVYMQLKIIIKKKCSCCNTESIVPTTVYFPVPRIKYRIREYYDGKIPKTIDSGIYEGGFPTKK